MNYEPIPYNAIPATRRSIYENAISQRISDVARAANSLIRQTGMTRTEALRLAETVVPQVV